MATQSIPAYASPDTFRIGPFPWRAVLARLDGYQRTCLAAIAIASVLRDAPELQWQVGSEYVTVHLVILVALSVWAAFRLLTLRVRDMTTGLLVSNGLFCVYAMATDSLRAFDSLAPLLIDLAYVVCPVVIAAAFFNSDSEEDNDEPLLMLSMLLAGIMLLYMGVAFFVYSLDFGDLLARRLPNLENLSFARVSGPVGGATSLCIITIPAIAFLYEKAVAYGRGATALWTGVVMLVVASGWTVSRSGIAVLLLLLAIQIPKRRLLLFGLIFLTLALSLNWGLQNLPEKWLRMGLSDPGRIDALGTTIAALTSNTEAFFTGVGSQRLNIITRTAAAVSRGELSFSSWQTEFGTFPYGPHSILLWALGSYGIIGALLRCWFLIQIYTSAAITWLRSGYFAGSMLPMAGILSSSGLFLDDSHILYPFLMIIWTIFYIYALRRIRMAR